MVQSFFNETDTLVQRAGEFFPPPLVMSMKAGSSLIFPSSSFRRVSAHEVGSALALQLLFLRASESMGNHDSNVVGAGRVG